MKLVDYGSDSDSEGSQEQEVKQPVQKVQEKQSVAPVTISKNEEKDKQQDKKEELTEDGKKKVSFKYKDFIKILNPPIHKEDKKADSWQPKSISQIQNDRKKRMEDLSESNDSKAKMTKVMRLPSPKNRISNEEISSYDLKKQSGSKPVLPTYINPDSLFNEQIDQTLVDQYDQEDVYINKRYQNIQENNEAESREAKYAVNRNIHKDELEFMDQDTKSKDEKIKVVEISREQIIGDSNWLLNYQKQQQQNITKSGYTLNSQVDKTQKSKNQLNALAVDAIANQDHLDYERSEQIKNAKRKRDRYGW